MKRSDLSREQFEDFRECCLDEDKNMKSVLSGIIGFFGFFVIENETRSALSSLFQLVSACFRFRGNELETSWKRAGNELETSWKRAELFHF
eukprot:Pgem_evm1s12306